MTAPSGTPAPGTTAARRWRLVMHPGVALVLGALTALPGTALHGRVVQVAGGSFPWGAAAALLLVFCTCLFTALWLCSPWLAVATGAGAYGCVGLLSLPRNGYGLVLSNVPGNVWLFGIAIVAPLAVLVAARILHGFKRGQK